MITEERHHLLRIMVKDINRFIEFDYMDNGYLDEPDRRLKLLEDMFIYKQKTINGKPHYLLAIPKERYLK
jgi:hypothetical protein